jgi:CheY-like chemotaxis protein
MQQMERTRFVDILMVEDDPADADLAREVLETSKLLVNLHVVDTGEACLRFLDREEPYESAPRPDLILLDLNLPGMRGQEVLEHIKNDPEKRRIPVVILTSSQAERDIVQTYDLGANCYVTKPVDLAQFTVIVKSIETFWFSIVQLPRD